MTFDLDLDLENTLDAGLPVDHRVQVWWRSGQLSARRSDLHAQKFIRRTDDGRLAIALAHSWNELKIVDSYIPVEVVTINVTRPHAKFRRRTSRRFRGDSKQTLKATLNYLLIGPMHIIA